MKEYEIKLSNGDVFYRDDDGLCCFSEKIVVNESDAIEELAEEVVRLNAGIERLRAENERLKVKIEKLEVSDEFISQFRLNGSEFKDRHISDVFNDFMKRFSVEGKGDQNGNSR